jgi:hypothetical protein
MRANQMAWAEAWQKTRYQHLSALRLARQAPWLYQNPSSFLDYKQKKSNHHDKRRRIIKAKEVGSLQTTWIDIFDYLPTGDKGRAIVFLLILM